jgi:hypothetical protein
VFVTLNAFDNSTLDGGTNPNDYITGLGTTQLTIDLGSVIADNVNIGGKPGIELSLAWAGDAFQDLDDNPVAAKPNDGSFTFRLLDKQTGVPAITGRTPNVGGTNVGTEPVTTAPYNFQLVFDEAVTPMAGSNVTLFYDDATDNVAIYTWDLDMASSYVASLGNTVYSFELPFYISGNTDYFIVVDNGAFVNVNAETIVTTGAPTEWNFTTIAAETVTRIPTFTFAPVDGSVNQGVADIDGITQTFALTFNERVTAEPGKFLTVYYTHNDQKAVEFALNSVTPDVSTAPGSVFSYTTSSLSGSTDYYIQITDGMTATTGGFLDASGNAIVNSLNNTTAWNYGTAVENDDPDLVTYTPANGSGNFDIRSPLVIDFDEPVYVTNNNITLTPTNTAFPPTAATVVINAQDNPVSGNGTEQISITPTEDLFEGMQYTVTFPNATFQDNASNDFDKASNAWVFDTQDGVYVANAATGTNTDNSSTPTMVVGINSADVFIDQNMYHDRIFIKETNNNDFRGDGSAKNIRFEFTDPDFHFNNAMGVGSVSINGGPSTDVTINSFTIGTVDDHVITIDLTIDAAPDDLDVIEISGLQIRYVGDNPNATAELRRVDNDANSADLYGLSETHDISIMDISVENITVPTLVAGVAVAGQIQTENTSWCEYNDGGMAETYDTRYSLENATTDVELNGIVSPTTNLGAP